METIHFGIARQSAAICFDDLFADTSEHSLVPRLVVVRVDVTPSAVLQGTRPDGTRAPWVGSHEKPSKQLRAHDHDS
jgi:hypothetical protein